MTRFDPLQSFGHVGSFSSSQETDSRVKFYDKYYKVAEEYDKVFMKKHEEDLNTTLIFVSSLPGIAGFMLTGNTGWFVLCRHVGFHRRHQPTTAFRSERRDGRSPSCPHPKNRQHRFWGIRPKRPNMDWPATCDRSSSEHPIFKFSGVTIFRVACHARQAVVEPIRLCRYARARYREKPAPSTKTQWNCSMVFRPCDGMPTHHASILPPTPWMCPFPVSLGAKYNHRSCRPRSHFAWCPRLHDHSYHGNVQRELSVPDPRLPFHPLPLEKISKFTRSTFYHIFEFSKYSHWVSLRHSAQEGKEVVVRTLVV